MIRCISGSRASPPLDLKQKTRFQIQEEKKMYVQHPYKYEGKYYAKIDGVFYEISKEVAMAMFAEYRNEIYRSRKWAPESEEDDQMEDFQDLENKQEKEEPADQKDKKWKRKTRRCEILDCAFSANSDGLSIADMSDDTQMSMEEMMILKEESRILHEKIDKLSLQEQFIIKSIYFDDMKQKDVAEILGVTKGALSQRLNTILRKMRNMYMEG
jgi:RNA polymerase sigma factor (sigma-70 family)